MLCKYCDRFGVAPELLLVQRTAVSLTVDMPTARLLQNRANSLHCCGNNNNNNNNNNARLIPAVTGATVVVTKGSKKNRKAKAGKQPMD
jgi:hypothetical protein